MLYFILTKPWPCTKLHKPNYRAFNIRLFFFSSAGFARFYCTIQVRSTTACDSFDIERCRIETVSVSNIQLAIVRSAFCCTLSDL